MGKRTDFRPHALTAHTIREAHTNVFMFINCRQEHQKAWSPPCRTPATTRGSPDQAAEALFFSALLNLRVISLCALTRGWGRQHFCSLSTPHLIHRPSVASPLMKCDLSCKARHDSAIFIAGRLSRTAPCWIDPHIYQLTSVATADEPSLAYCVSGNLSGYRSYTPHARNCRHWAGLVGLNFGYIFKLFNLLSKNMSDPKCQTFNCVALKVFALRTEFWIKSTIRRHNIFMAYPLFNDHRTVFPISYEFPVLFCYNPTPLQYPIFLIPLFLHWNKKIYIALLRKLVLVSVF